MINIIIIVIIIYYCHSIFLFSYKTIFFNHLNRFYLYFIFNLAPNKTGYNLTYTL